MSDELATPEHDKLLAEPEMLAQLERLFEWMSKRGRDGKGGGTNRVAICEYRERSIPEKFKCPDCHGSGKDITKLSQRQQQVVKHMDLLKGEKVPWETKKKAEHEKALSELDQWLGELGKCDNCYGEGEATVYRMGVQEWQPVFASARDVLLAFVGADRRAFDAEMKELFAQLRQQAKERPTEMSDLQKARADGDGIDPH